MSIPARHHHDVRESEQMYREFGCCQEELPFRWTRSGNHWIRLVDKGRNPNDHMGEMT
jgi:hypothetical protein